MSAETRHNHRRRRGYPIVQQDYYFIFFVSAYSATMTR